MSTDLITMVRVVRFQHLSQAFSGTYLKKAVGRPQVIDLFQDGHYSEIICVMAKMITNQQSNYRVSER